MNGESYCNETNTPWIVKDPVTTSAPWSPEVQELGQLFEPVPDMVVGGDVNTLCFGNSNGERSVLPEIQFFPNPSTGMFQWSEGNSPGVTSVQVIDVFGQIVMTGKPDRDRFHCFSLPRGLYAVRLYNDQFELIGTGEVVME